MCRKKECCEILTANKHQIQNEFGVTSMAIFGSVARGDDRPDSDVDILVDMPPKILLMSGLKDYLESILNTSVDVIRRHTHLSEKFLNQISYESISIF